MRALVGLTVIFLALTGAAHADVLPPQGWVVYPTPKPGACEWMRANYSNRNWKVSLDNGRLSITLIDNYAPPKPAPKAWPKFQLPPSEPNTGMPCIDCVLRVDDGWLVGFNHSDLLGRLWWTDPNGRSAYVVTDGGRTCRGQRIGPHQRHRENEMTNIVSLTRAGDRVLAISDFMHMEETSGRVSLVEKRNAKWRSCILSGLGGAPHVAIADVEATWLVLARKGLFRVHGDGQGARLGHFSFLDEPVFPNSMVKLRDETLYVGMTHFVARLLPEKGGYRAELLLPSDRPPFDYDEMIDGYPNAFSGCKRLRK